MKRGFGILGSAWEEKTEYGFSDLKRGFLPEDAIHSNLDMDAYNAQMEKLRGERKKKLSVNRQYILNGLEREKLINLIDRKIKSDCRGTCPKDNEFVEAIRVLRDLPEASPEEADVRLQKLKDTANMACATFLQDEKNRITHQIFVQKNRARCLSVHYCLNDEGRSYAVVFEGVDPDFSKFHQFIKEELATKGWPNTEVLTDW